MPDVNAQDFRGFGGFGQARFRAGAARCRFAIRQIDDADAITLPDELGQRPQQ